ncbi:MAG: tetraacyldisaccharide 4'-kinase [Planctomycetota bacterium]|nr:tetraacyldisaccharide 4'-kinase [Planctomycetota bacterium]
MNQDNYRKLISGKTAGPAAVVLRLGLRFISLFYAAVIRLRNFLYDNEWLKVTRVNAVVISIGNITTGGTGKTPLVIRLYKQIVQNSKYKMQNCGIAILTRGYKTTKNYVDEPQVLAKNCPDAKVIINPDRVAAAREAINKFAAKVLIMDDGFQHRRLHRDLDIVTIDAACPFGFNRILPAGLLREPLNVLKRADAVVITRCDQIPQNELANLKEKLRQINPNMVIAKAIHSPVGVRTTDGKKIGIAELTAKNIFAFCGIGNPDAFFNTIRKIPANLIGSKIYDDHHHYCADDITDIQKQAQLSKAGLILTTEKDAMKIISDSKLSIPLGCLEIELKFIDAEQEISGLIDSVLSDKIPAK